MLIAVSDAPPENAFASINHGGKWYYIFDDDEVSKKTIALIIQINTIQAIPTQSAPLTPTISVGGWSRPFSQNFRPISSPCGK